MNAVLDVVLGSRCALCGAPGPEVCGRCLMSLAPARSEPRLEGLPDLVALFDYDNGGRELVAALKYRGRTTVAGFAGARLATAVAQQLAWRPTVVTWAPTTADRRRQRGFDQADLLARATGRALGVPVRRCLVRHGRHHQTGRARAERQALGPRFTARAALGQRLLVVDDVVTTGATLVSAHRALFAAGAAEVAVASVARVEGPPR